MKVSSTITCERMCTYVCISLHVDYEDDRCTPFDVRLSYRELNNATGNLQICLAGQWESVCLPSSQDVVNIACRALGFTDFEDLPLNHRVLSPVVDAVSRPPVEVFLSCSGAESNLTECSVGPLAGRRRRQTEACSASNAARVGCLGESSLL